MEEMLKAGELPCLVATSSLELGIDMGAVDLVIQVESPKSVSRGLQRIGRAGHSVGDVSRAGSSPSSVPTCSSARSSPGGCARPRSRRPSSRATRWTCSPSRSSRSPPQTETRRRRKRPSVNVDDLYALVTRTHSYAELTRPQLENVLDMLDGRYPSSEFAELRPRIVWDRVAGTIRRAAGCPPAGGHQRGHDPRPRPLRRHAARRPPRRRARRGDGLRGAARPDVPARRHHLADRGDRPRSRDRDPRPGPAGCGPVLEGRHARAPARARPGDRRVLRWAVDQSAETLQADYDLDERRPTTCWPS